MNPRLQKQIERNKKARERKQSWLGNKRRKKQDRRKRRREKDKRKYCLECHCFFKECYHYKNLAGRPKKDLAGRPKKDTNIYTMPSYATHKSYATKNDNVTTTLCASITYTNF